MTNLKIKLLAFGLLLLLAYGCKKDILGEGEITTTSPVPNVWIESTVIGLVQDEAGLPLSNVEVDHIGNNILTDENGFFSLPTRVTTLSGGYITFKKEGFFENSKFFIHIDAEDYSYLRVTMLDLGTPEVIDASEPTTIDVDNAQARILFQEDGFVDATGSAYSGAVSVYTKYIDPTGIDLVEIMPGDLRGIDTEEARVQLSTFGMLAAELRGVNGQELQLAAGKSAEIKMLIPEELQNSIPENVPTWSYDENIGYWIEEGTASETADGYYTAEVTHFSYWNYDAPWPTIRFCARLTYLNGAPVANTRVSIKIVDSGITKCDWTNQRGKVGGEIPQGQLLEIIVHDECGNVIYREEFGPFDEDNLNINITIPDSDLSILNVQGTLTCDGNPVTNGYVHIVSDDLTRYVVPTDGEGNYELNLNDCALSSVQVTVQGFDLEEPGIGKIEEIILVEGMATLDQEVCADDEGEYLTVEHNIGIVFNNPSATLLNGKDINIRSGTAAGTSDFIEFTIQDAFQGQGNSTSSVFGLINQNAFVCLNNSCLQNFSVNLAQTGSAIGDIIEGTYEGQIPTPTGNETINGGFKISIKDIGQTAQVSGIFYFDNNDNGMYDQEDELLDQNPAITLTEVDGLSLQNSGTQGEFEFQNVITQREYTFTIDLGGGIDFASETPFDLNCEGIEFNPSTRSSSTFILEDSGITCLDIPFKRTPFICEDNVNISIDFVDCGETMNRLNVFNPLNEEISFAITSVNNDPIFNFEVVFIAPGSSVLMPVESGTIAYTISDANLDILCESEIFAPIEASIDDCIEISQIGCRGAELEYGVEFNCNGSNVLLTYQWSNGQTTPTFSTSVEGLFTVTVTDANGCAGSATVEASFSDLNSANGFVWLDSNDSGTVGVFEETEDRLSDLTVILSEGDPSNVIDQVQTNQNGEYTFTDLSAGNAYHISFALPMEFEFSPKCIGNDTELNSKIDPDSGYAEFRLECDPQIDGVNSPSNLNIGIKPL